MRLGTFAEHVNRRFFRRSQSGQAIILLALGMVVLLVFVGLVTDVALLFVRYSQLRRAIDAASIAAAGQVRENRDYADVALTARQFIRLYDLDPDRVLVQTCVTNPTDPALCVNPPRKLVRVIAQVDSPTTFLRLIGWNTITLETSAIAETAVLDVALVLDISESMSRSTTQAHYNAIYNAAGLSPRAECIQSNPYNPYTGDNLPYGGCCNDPGNGTVDLAGNVTGVTSNVANGDYRDLICQPFKQARDAARTFIQRLDFVRGDRVAFVTLGGATSGTTVVVPNNPSGSGTLPPLVTDEAVAIRTLDYQIGVGTPHATGMYNDCETSAAAWWSQWGYSAVQAYTYRHVAPCPDTNMGGGILAANSILTNPLYVRRQAVWVIILLSDGAATITNRATRLSGGTVQDVGTNDYGYYGYCPWWTFCDPEDPVNQDDPECMATGGADPTDPNAAPGSPYAHSSPFCSDGNFYSRHFCMDAQGRINIDDPNCSDFYDATDYAMDMADFAGLVEVRPGVEGNFIAMYTIGFGVPGDPIPPLGEYTLRYIADAGDNGVIDNNWQQDCRNDQVCGNEGGTGTVPGLPYNPNNYPAAFGPPDPCEIEVAGNQQDCGQYWYAQSSADLERVFAEIASRLFTRLAR